MTAYELDLPTIKLFNAEAGIGLDLVIDQDPSEGTFDVRISFPDEYFPALEGYNRFWAEVVAEENEFIFGLIENLVTWIGGNDIANEGT